MNPLREAAQQALEALEMSRRFVYADNRPQCDDAIEALRVTLKQEAEAAAWLAERKNHWRKEREKAQAAKDQDPELSAALGWPGGISNPVLDRVQLLQMVAALRVSAQQALEFLEAEFGWSPGEAPRIDALRAALAQQDEPVARECSDPMCACRGGPCAECEEGEREKEIEDLRSSLYFYQRRCEALQSWQSKMRDPERTIVCDILANGKTLDPAVAGNRYTTPQQAEPVQEPEGLDWRYTARIGYVVKPYTAPPQRVAQQDEPVQEPIRLDCSSPLVVHPHPAFQTTPPKAEPVEPVAWMCSNPELMAKGYERFASRCEGDWNIPVYAAPPQRQPLTEEVAALTAQRDALLKVLKYLDKAFRQHGRQHWPEAVRVAAAIKAVEETK